MPGQSHQWREGTGTRHVINRAATASTDGGLEDLLQIGPGDREGPTIFRVDVGGHAKQGLNEPEGLYPKEETGVRSTVEHGEYVLVNS